MNELLKGVLIVFVIMVPALSVVHSVLSYEQSYVCDQGRILRIMFGHAIVVNGSGVRFTVREFDGNGLEGENISFKVMVDGAAFQSYGNGLDTCEVG